MRGWSDDETKRINKAAVTDQIGVNYFLQDCLVVSWLVGWSALTFNRHPFSLKRHLDFFSFPFSHAEAFAKIIHDSARIALSLSIWVARG